MSPSNPVVPIRKLIEEHARVWARAGTSNSGLVFDPAAGFLLEGAHKHSKLLLDRFTEQQAEIERLQSNAVVYEDLCITISSQLDTIEQLRAALEKISETILISSCGFCRQTSLIIREALEAAPPITDRKSEDETI